MYPHQINLDEGEGGREIIYTTEDKNKIKYNLLISN